MDDTRVEQSKFETGGAPPSLDPDELPWSYGEDRVTVMVRDPESAYVYWEITDPGIAAARARLGPAGDGGWCSLRVYDTTGRDFDGVNANDYFDLSVDRGDREYFLMIRRPGSSLHVEVGIKTHEGYFQPVARSGRCDFPRVGPSSDTTLSFMNVTSEGAPPCVSPCRSRYGGPEPQLPAREAGGYVDVWRAGYTPPAERDAPEREHAAWSPHPVGQTTHIERWWNVEEWRAEWRAGLRFMRWEQLDPQRIAVELLGEQPESLRVEGGEMLAFGSLRLTIRRAETGAGPRVISTWSMRWVKASTPMIETWHRVAERRVVEGWEREHVVLGASETQGLLQRGASEVGAMGGSVRLWLGASEWAANGASELRWMGASELLGVAASVRLGGSERLGSEQTLGGPGGGASEVHAPEGGAGGRGGARERWGGRLEGGGA